MGLITTAFCAVFIVIIIYYFVKRSLSPRRKLPQGLTGLAALTFIVKCVRHGFDEETSKLMKQYKTDLLSIDLFGLKTIVVFGSNIKAVEAYQKKGEYLLKRPVNPVKPDTVGLLGGYGHSWREQRRFALTTLRNFGMGKEGVEARVLHEVRNVLNEFTEKKGRPFDPLTSMGISIVNVVSSVIFSSTFSLDDPDMNVMLGMFNNLASGHRPLVTLSMFPFFFNLPLIKSGVAKRKKATNVTRDIMARRIETKTNFDGTNVDDFVDAYMVEMKRHEEEPDTSFTQEQLIEVVEDLFGAGSETTSTTLRWALLLMCCHPEIQNKVNAELVEQIGHNRLPNYNDRERTPYTEAVLLEVQRYASLVPIIRRENTESVELFGYEFETGTNFVSNLWHMHRDQDVWERPDQFYPEHFIDNAGKSINREKFNPFGVGKRQCIGESLARMELYLFFTSFILTFILKPADDMPSPSEASVGLVRAPKPYRLIALKRD